MAVLCQNKGHGTAHHGRSDCSTDARSTGNYPGAAGQDRCVGGGGRGTAKADARQDTSELLRTPEHRVISTGLQNLFGAAAVVRNAPAAVPSGPRVKRGELATRRQSESRGLVSETAVCGRGGGVDMGPTAPRRCRRRPEIEPVWRPGVDRLLATVAVEAVPGQIGNRAVQTLAEVLGRRVDAQMLDGRP